MHQGTVLRIEKISPHDGMGLRTVVFLKGCPLRCAWCSTPESQSPRPEWYYKQSKCRRCTRCIQACPKAALSLSSDGHGVLRDKSRCDGCFGCVSACPPHAIGVYGKKMTVDAVMKDIRKDTLFYFCSQGGVTLSGGDILLQADFSRALLQACREDCINTTAELDMYGPYENAAKVLEYLDSYFVDLKLMDSVQHRRWTGVDNQSILENTLRASMEFPDKPLYVRVPLIPGINDSSRNVLETVQYCEKLQSCKALEFLPYHRLGDAAYRYLDRPYSLELLPPMTLDEAHRSLGSLNKRNLPFALKIAGGEITCAK